MLKRKGLSALIALLLAMPLVFGGTTAMASDPFIAQIVMFGGTFAPRGWAFCEGQLLPISQNTALFSLLGTTYGGDGRTSFGLPDLRGRVPLHPGTGPGLSTYRLGQKGGAERVTLTTNQLPSHKHDATGVATLRGTPRAGNRAAPGFPGGIGRSLAKVEGHNQYSTRPPTADMHPDSIQMTVAVGNTGGGQAVEIRQPYIALNYIIALVGIYPSRQ